MSVPTLSVVVPAHNEAKVIAETLECLFDQIDRIDEIIVVDNNSTDDTAEIVTSMLARSPKLKLIKERTQGLIAARNAGVDAATSEIIGRIDADTMVHEGWAASITDYFAEAPEDVGAVTGPLVPYDTPPSFRDNFVSAQDAAIERILAETGDEHAIYGIEAVRGPNMAFRKSVWQQICGDLTTEPYVYEDLDFALCVQKAGYRLAGVVDMRADVSGRRFLTSRKSYWEYTAQLPRTWKAHGSKKRARASRREMWTNRTMYLFYWLPNRAYDAEAGKFSLGNVFASREDLVIPTSGGGADPTASED
ncbi:glycosyltransferase [Rhodococcus sp. D2-41]|uniref:glycosyltransferase n=1 Tax=Speluncibacter jeojiensis TaxID=2710754 RepID=UPI0024102A0C|nr:glycosyltransferase family A protein [Rhodococcus sp. D2-41]MDG3009120.1 glycosyltransferase [Rhodococcus sp. D2-41]